MKFILIVAGLVVLGYGVFGVFQPTWNKPRLFWTPGGTAIVFVVGLGLLLLALVAG